MKAIEGDFALVGLLVMVSLFVASSSARLKGVAL
jgi:hypothetical protein